jgi:hypothetical protein
MFLPEPPGPEMPTTGGVDPLQLTAALDTLLRIEPSLWDRRRTSSNSSHGDDACSRSPLPPLLSPPPAAPTSEITKLTSPASPKGIPPPLASEKSDTADSFDSYLPARHQAMQDNFRVHVSVRVNGLNLTRPASPKSMPPPLRGVNFTNSDWLGSDAPPLGQESPRSVATHAVDPFAAPMNTAKRAWMLAAAALLALAHVPHTSGGGGDKARQKVLSLVATTAADSSDASGSRASYAVSHECKSDEEGDLDDENLAEAVAVQAEAAAKAAADRAAAAKARADMATLRARALRVSSPPSSTSATALRPAPEHRRGQSSGGSVEQLRPGRVVRCVGVTQSEPRHRPTIRARGMAPSPRPKAPSQARQCHLQPGSTGRHASNVRVAAANNTNYGTPI